MNLKTRIKQLEQKNGLDKYSDNCRCQNPHIKVRSAGMRERNVITGGVRGCERCGKPVCFKQNAKIKVIKPKLEMNEAEFMEWQKDHVKSTHQTYAEFLGEV